MKRLSRPLPRVSAWAEPFIEAEPEEEYQAAPEPKNVTPKQSFADRIDAWHTERAAKARILQRNAWLNGALGLILGGLGGLWWPAWLLGVLFLCVGFEQFREATHCRRESRMLPDPNDLML